MKALEVSKPEIPVGASAAEVSQWAQGLGLPQVAWAFLEYSIDRECLEEILVSVQTGTPLAGACAVKELFALTNPGEALRLVRALRAL
jgi:hypothetical protein